MSRAVAVCTGAGISSSGRSTPGSGVVPTTSIWNADAASVIVTVRETGAADCTSIDTDCVANPLLETSSR